VLSIKKAAIIFLLFLFVSSNLVLPVSAETPVKDQKLDVVFAVDVSNSMTESDKNKVSNEAMKMFVDMLSERGDKVGMVAYTDKIIREKALLDLQSETDKKEFKNYIDSLSKDAYTDIAVGVKEAVTILKSGEVKGHSPIIILLTDGNNFLKKGGPRTQKQSDSELSASIKTAQDKGYPIYTIGLNADGTLNKSVLQNIAKQTNGKFFETSSADRLPKILSEIFAQHLKLKVVPITSLNSNGQFQDVVINIPNSSVMEANISVTSSKPIEAKLFGPDGKSITIPSAGIVYSKSQAYSLIKLIKPKSGDWKLQVKGVNKDKVDINMVFNYDLNLAAKKLEEKSYKEGETVKLEAFLESNGKAIESADIYSGMTAKVIVKDTKSNLIEEIDLKNSGKDFNGEFKIPDNLKYELVIRAEDNSFYRETKPFILDASAAVTTAAPAPKVKKEAEKTPWVIYGIVGLAILSVIAAVYAILSYLKKANKGFIGQMIVVVRDQNTGEKSTPQYRKLNSFKGKMKLHQLLQLAPEFAETSSVLLFPGKNDTITLVNKGDLVIEKSGRTIDATKGITVKKNEQLKFNLHKVNKTVTVDYII
jgi:Ca-activated chloride channel homolog